MMEVKVKFPKNFQKERAYTLNVLFSYFEEIDLKLIPEDRTDYLIMWGNSTLIIEDHFWKNESESEIEQLWKRKPSAPERIEISELNVSIISSYGEPNIVFDKNSIVLKSDIIASAFFFLSRWEEWVSKRRDEHDRFPDTESYLIMHGLHRVPLVNEYIEFLRQVLSRSRRENVTYNRSYTAFITHDVDEIFRYKPVLKWGKAIVGDLVHRKDPVSATQSFGKGFFTQFSPKHDDSQTFDYLMDISEKYDLKSHFYFIPGEKGEKDFRYSISSTVVKKLIKHIVKRDHYIGIHPSYRSKDDPAYFREEVLRLQQIVPYKLEEGRHHYLRMNFPDTLRYWEQNELKVDSSLGFHDHAGFRAGMCYEYPIYDLESREVTNVIERPLTIMETALERNVNSAEDFKNQVRELVETTFKYQGDLVFLWHNNNIHHPFWKKLGSHYEDLIKIIAK